MSFMDEDSQNGRKRLKGECWCRRLHERKEPGIMPTARRRATESPWFLGEGQKPTGERSER
jgi:hypothetical protein